MKCFVILKSLDSNKIPCYDFKMKFIKYTPQPQKNPKTKIKHELYWCHARYILETFHNVPFFTNDKDFDAKLDELLDYINTKLPLPDETGEVVDEYVIVEVY